MDRRLIEASQTGNTLILHQLLAENSLILHTIALSSPNNPLHVASAAGHVDFVKEIMRVKPEFAKQLNQDGFSPIHIASANGYLEIVREFLGVDRRLCRTKGTNKWTPLHLAASRGSSDIVLEILSACPESIEDVNVQNETALHLAVKSSQFETIDVILKWIKEMNKIEILNMRDEFGNSVLHLATWRKHRPVIEWLLWTSGTATTTKSTTSRGAVLLVNAINKTGLTALDLLLIFPSEAGDREIEGLLRNAGAQRTKEDVAFSHSPTFVASNSSTTNQQTLLDQAESAKELVEYFKFKRGRDSPSDARSALLVSAALVATATFQAGINPPSGIWQDTNLNGNGNGNGNGSTPNHEAGRSILGSYSSVAYVLFAVFNSFGLSVSVYMLTILTMNLPLQLEFQLCVFALYFTYYTAVINMAPESASVFMITMNVVLPMTTYYIVKLIRILAKKLNGSRILSILLRTHRFGT